ncbi:MAG: VCBS repeat-containing protein [Verrucomicrobia bacterium]|nr:MAG: VCBS repeat-containing protein [Verrucomicrobiota bacterium]
MAGIALILSPVVSAGQFEPPINYFLNRSLNGIAKGDFNGDGNIDLVLPGCGDPNCTTTGSVYVLLGKGNGQFTRGGRFVAAPGTDAIALSTGDFNRDGTPDLVVINNAINRFGTVSVLLGDGNGGFLPPVSYRVGGAVPIWSAVADFNRDGNPDLAISVTTTDSVAVLLGNGDGTFQPAVNYTVGGGPQGIATGDVNGDGFPDIVSADECGDDPACRDGTVSVLLGNGDGTFQPRLVFAEGIFPLSVAIADFNGDHRPDLAIANPCGTDGACATVGSVGIMLGNGDGTFQPVVNYPTTSYGTLCVDVGKFNHDRYPDVVAVNIDYSNITVLTGNGDGTFQPGDDYVVGLNPNAVTVGQFNQDNAFDIAVTDRNSFEVSVLLNNRSGHFQGLQQ